MISIESPKDALLRDRLARSPSPTTWSVFVNDMSRLFRQWQQWR